MDAIQMLRDDHKHVKDLFKQFEEAKSAAEKKRIVTETCDALETHTRLEEEVFYPAIRKEGADKAMMNEADEEHRLAKLLIEELRCMAPKDEYYDAKYTVLAENVKHHIGEEETEMLPKAAEAGAEQMRELGERMSERKREIEATGPDRSATRSKRAAPAAATANRASKGRERVAARKPSVAVKRARR